MSWRALKHSHTTTPSPQGAQPLKWPATPSIYRGKPQTSHYTQIPYKTEALRTVRPTGPGRSAISNPTAISSINASRSRPLQPGRTVRLANDGQPAVYLDTQNRKTKFLRPFQFLKADRPPPGAGRSAVYFGPPSRAKISSVRAQTRQRRTVRPT